MWQTSETVYISFKRRMKMQLQKEVLPVLWTNVKKKMQAAC